VKVKQELGVIITELSQSEGKRKVEEKGDDVKEVDKDDVMR